MTVEEIISENERRKEANAREFDPISGKGSTGERHPLVIPGLGNSAAYVPTQMLEDPDIDWLRHHSVDEYIEKKMHLSPTQLQREKVATMVDRIRCRHDFPYWAAKYVYIKQKGGGEDVLFRLNRPQRKFVEIAERARTASKPIRIIMLKARQWGGSTCSQIYMSWLQLIHKTGLNSLIIAHQTVGSDEIKDMFDRMISRYPLKMLYEPGEKFKENEKKIVGVGMSGSNFRVPQRNFKIKVGTAERPDSCRGGDYNLVHCSEVGIWKATAGKSPEMIIRSACSGILFEPLTMIVYESTANGTGNYFETEYKAAVRGESQFEPLFISWYDIDKYSTPLADPKGFAAMLLAGRENTTVDSDRRQPGSYLWWLWNKGATLEAINWYISERMKYNSHGMMASEYPSDDVEAFVNSGANVFDRYKVEEMATNCRPPEWHGEIADGKFISDTQGCLDIWRMPEKIEGVRVSDRYLTVVDIGGRSDKADWSVVVVFDRMLVADGGVPEVVAQWRGHIDIDLLAWKAVDIAAFYDKALLVVESNTLETHDRYRHVEGDQSAFILSEIREVYPNLYARRRSEEDIRRGSPKKYGFHTNTSTKPMVISALVKAVREKGYIERDKRCLDELNCYERRQNGSYAAQIGHHDDMLMTRAIGLHISTAEMNPPRVTKIESRNGKRGYRVNGNSHPATEASIT